MEKREESQQVLRCLTGNECRNFVELRCIDGFKANPSIHRSSTKLRDISQFVNIDAAKPCAEGEVNVDGPFVMGCEGEGRWLVGQGHCLA